MNVNGKDYPIYIYFIYYGIYWLVVDLLKNMSSSVGMMTFPTEWKIIQMFQSTNQFINM